MAKAEETDADIVYFDLIKEYGHKTSYKREREYTAATKQDFIINITVGNNDQGMTATQYSKVTEMIKAYTGKANNFKTGLVFDDDPEFGDKVNITVIVTGIKMPIIQPQVEIGNIIHVDSNFVYRKHENTSGVPVS